MTRVASFLANFGAAKVGNAGHGIATWLATKDPITASQVDIDDLRRQFNELGGEVSKAEQDDERSYKVVVEQETALVRTKQAAQMLGAEVIKLGADTPQGQTMNHELSTLVDRIEALAGPEGDASASGTLYDARKDHLSAETYLHKLQQLHAGAAATLAEADRTRKQALRDMDQARREEDRARQRQAQAERVAGLTSGLQAGSVALQAMEETAEKSKLKARAMTLNTEALTNVTAASASADDIVARTLGEKQAAPSSALDRLARMTGGTTPPPT